MYGETLVTVVEYCTHDDLICADVVRGTQRDLGINSTNAEEMEASQSLRNTSMPNNTRKPLHKARSKQ